MFSPPLLVDWLYGSALFFNAALFIPQAWRLIVTKSAQGSSLITFAGFNCVQMLGILNGVFHHDKALILGQSVSLFACSLVTLQLLYYKCQERFVS